MKKLTPLQRRDLVDAAMGRRPFDLLIRNINLVNVFSGEIYPAEIGICHGYIAYIHGGDPDQLPDPPLPDNQGIHTFDGEGLYAVPGYIDSHMHIESSMLTPGNFARVVVPRGTTAIVTDPHEIANVMGIRGVQYMMEAAQGLPMYQFALAPSCVPAAPGLESSGAVFGRDEIEQLLDIEDILGVAEVMDYYGVINNSSRMRDILDLALERDVFVQGHFFSESPRELAAYLCGGPRSNHEFMKGADALRAIRAGMTVDARDSSFERNTRSIVEALGPLGPLRNFTLCTDDREPEEIRAKGHIDDCIRIAVDAGMAPLEALKAATINTASLYGLRTLGALAPGYIANINLIDNLEDLRVRKVFFEGQLVAENGYLSGEVHLLSSDIEKENTVFLEGFSEDFLCIRAPVQVGEVKVRVIKHLNLKTSLTEESIESIPVEHGFLSLKNNKDLNYIAIFNRHKGNKDFSTGLIRNFHLKEGALAGTVCHDSHNLALVYTNQTDALRAIKEIRRIGGGIVYVCGDRVESLELPIAGLMSFSPAEELTPQVERMNRILALAGLEADNPVMRLATISLPVIPDLKITDKGLVDTKNQIFVDLFVS